MRHEIRFWSWIILLFLALITGLVFFLLRNIIKYYRAPDEILPQKWNLVAANALIPPIPAIIIVNNYISHLSAFKDQFEANGNLYPVAIFVTLLILIIVVGLIFEQYNILTNSEYRCFRSGTKKDS
jgi:hypothetical protein